MIQQSFVDIHLRKLKSGSQRSTDILPAHCRVTHNRQAIESAKMLTRGGADKENHVSLQ